MDHFYKLQNIMINKLLKCLNAMVICTLQIHVIIMDLLSLAPIQSRTTQIYPLEFRF